MKEVNFVAKPLRDKVRELVLGFHYSGRMPNYSYAFGFEDEHGVLLAACVFSTPAGGWSVPLLELTRLVRREGAQINLTSLLSKAVKAIRREGKHDLLISFADSSQGHHGGVYQASSWNYSDTLVPRVDGFVIDGVFVPSRTCVARYGTCSATRLPALLKERGSIAEAHRDTGKHLYWKALSTSGEQKALALNFKKEVYPKPLIRPVKYSWQRFRTEKR